MKSLVWTMSLLLAGTLAGRADEPAYWRIVASQTTLVTAITVDGVLAWSNSLPGQAELVQRATSRAPADWHDYVTVPATGTTTSVKAFDLNPPADMVLIPAGIFVMGNATNVFPFPAAGEGTSDALPQHTVNVSAFYMDVYEVTKALWDEVQAFNGGNGYGLFYRGDGKATDNPVHSVSWFDAVKWCNARSERDGLTPVYYTDAGFTTVYKTWDIVPFANWAANGYRLPTEAEWEKAARGGGANRRFPWGDTIQHARANYYSSNHYSYDLGDMGYHPTFATGGEPYTSPVGYFAPNGYGLYDMAGNVWEWCWDWYQYDYYASSPANDPRGPAGPLLQRVLRGGSWWDFPEELRVANRTYKIPTHWNIRIGFRCVRGL